MTPQTSGSTRGANHDLFADALKAYDQVHNAAFGCFLPGMERDA